MSRQFLADFIFAEYVKVHAEFQELLDDSQISDESAKEKFLKLWFLWEVSKTATEVFVPSDPAIYSPPAARENKEGEYAVSWNIKNIPAEKVESNIKASYHHNTYQAGGEMPLGLISLLPVSSYFPGDPVSAFHYALEIDFFDIKDADLYPAVTCALIADLLGGTDWDEIMDRIVHTGLVDYVKCGERVGLGRLQNDVNKALRISRKHKTYERSRFLPFVKELHEVFAVGEEMMCTVDEMFGVSVALMDYAGTNLKNLIEAGVNYGRDNDTVASITASLGGAALGPDGIPKEWWKTVREANADDDIDGIVGAMSKL